MEMDEFLGEKKPQKLPKTYTKRNVKPCICEGN